MLHIIFTVTSIISPLTMNTQKSQFECSIHIDCSSKFVYSSRFSCLYKLMSKSFSWRVNKFKALSRSQKKKLILNLEPKVQHLIYSPLTYVAIMIFLVSHTSMVSLFPKINDFRLHFSSLIIISQCCQYRTLFNQLKYHSCLLFGSITDFREQNIPWQNVLVFHKFSIQ